MSSQVFLFIGENAFALVREKRTWLGEFMRKHGSDNLILLRAAEITYRSLLDEIGVAPFIAEKRLVVVDGIPKFSPEEIEGVFRHIHPACVLVLSDAKPDRRTAAVKELLKRATVKEFPHLRGAKLTAWMRAVAQSQGSSLGEAEAASLIALSGEDEETLCNELLKLCLFAPDQPITREVIRALAVPSGEQEVWHLLQLLSGGKADEALAYARALLQQGEDPFALWNMLLWMCRHLVSVCAAASEGRRNPAKIASELHVPFPTAKTLVGLSARIDLRDLRAFLTWLVDAEIALKTGQYRATQEAPQELLVLLDRLIMRCAGL
ncbi:DNA polymerase III subunit delta [Candidatus Peregrinibacteria bacterium]|nr:DNA polymerase III subunit delta [Candidatus Peregrinibacteria bacterium]